MSYPFLDNLKESSATPQSKVRKDKVLHKGINDQNRHAVSKKRGDIIRESNLQRRGKKKSNLVVVLGTTCRFKSPSLSCGGSFSQVNAPLKK